MTIYGTCMDMADSTLEASSSQEKASAATDAKQWVLVLDYLMDKMQGKMPDAGRADMLQMMSVDSLLTFPNVYIWMNNTLRNLKVCTSMYSSCTVHMVWHCEFYKDRKQFSQE